MKNTLSALLSLKLLTKSGKLSLLIYGVILYLASSLNDSYTNVVVWMIFVPIMVVIITHNAMFKTSPMDSITNLEVEITQNHKVARVVKTVVVLTTLNIIIAFVSNTNPFTQKEGFDDNIIAQAVALLMLHLIMVIPFGTAFELVTCMTPNTKGEDKSVTSIHQSYDIINSSINEITPFRLGVGATVVAISVPMLSGVGSLIGHNAAVMLIIMLYTLAVCAIAIDYLGGGLSDKEYQELKGQKAQETVLQ